MKESSCQEFFPCESKPVSFLDLPRLTASISSATALPKDGIRRQHSSLLEQLMIPPAEPAEKLKTPKLELELDR